MAKGNSRKKVSLGTAGSKSRWAVARAENTKKNPFDRSKAVDQRNDTLLAEYAARKKSNVFSDRRFGANTNNLSAEEKQLQRFTLAKQKYHSKTSTYNLEEEDLTHMGQSLSEGGRLDDTIAFQVSSDEEDDSDRKAAAKTVKDTHFGGFLTKRQPGSGTDSGRRSQKEIMEEVVAKSKKKKAERQMQRDAVVDMTEKADEEWKALAGLLAGAKKEQPRPKPDDFDIAVRELGFEARKAKATDRTKTEEEMVEDEFKSLKEQEKERLRRMQVPENSDPAHTSQSVDSLISMSEGKKEARYTVRYGKDGKLVMPENKDEFVWKSGFPKKSEDDDTDSSDYDSEDSDDDDDEGSGGSEAEEEMDEEDDEDEDDEDDEDEEKDWNEEDDDLNVENGHQTVPKRRESSTDTAAAPTTSASTTSSVTPSSGLAFTFSAPASLKELDGLLRDKSPAHQTLVLERIRACNHPKLAAVNRGKMETLFGFVLEYLDNVVSEDSRHAPLIDSFSRPLLDLARDNMQETAQCMYDRLQESRQLVAEARKDPSRPCLPVKMRVTIQVAGAIYSTSDFRHRVVTPALVLMAEYLAQCSLQPGFLLAGLWICQLLVQYLRQSKRFVPEMVNFLTGVVAISVASASDDLGCLTPPFAGCSEKERAAVLATDEEHHVQKKYLSMSIRLLQQVAAMYSSMTAFTELFAPVHAYLQKVSSAHLSSDGQESHKSLLTRLSATPPRRAILQMLKKKPVPLKLFEPAVDERYQYCRKTQSGYSFEHHGPGRNQTEREVSKLKRKVKREEKSAQRQLRKDNQLIRSHALKEQLEKDAARRKKVNTILHDARQG